MNRLPTLGLVLPVIAFGCATAPMAEPDAAEPARGPSHTMPAWPTESRVGSAAATAPPAWSAPPLAGRSGMVSHWSAVSLRQDEMDTIHPRLFIDITGGYGEEDLEISRVFVDNSTSPPSLAHVVTPRDADGVFYRGRAELYSPVQAGGGVFFEGRTVDKINEDLGNPDSELGYWDLFAFVGFRAVSDDDFRMPVRVGWFFNQLTYEFITAGVESESEYESTGLRLSAEPEFILSQGKDSEISVYSEASVGFGPSTVSSGALASADGYGANVGMELGMRFRFSLVSLGAGIVFRKLYFGQTDPSETGNFFFTADSDFVGGIVSVGIRH